MATPDRDIYDSSSIDWIELNNLAKRVAKETLAPRSADYWVLDTRNWFRKELLQGYVNEQFQLYEYCLKVDGELFRQSNNSYLCFDTNGKLFSKIEENPEVRSMNEEDVMLLDFKPNYFEYSKGDAYGYYNYEPSKKLLQEIKGDCLRKLLNRLLERSLEGYIILANQGDVLAQIRLGELSFRGEGLDKDFNKGLEWYTKAANQGNIQAQSMLGQCLFHGKGITQNYQQAVEWYTKAGNQGDGDAQYALGECYAEGLGVAYNITFALEWYKKSADNGNIFAKEEFKKVYKRKMIATATTFVSIIAIFSVCIYFSFFRNFPATVKGLQWTDFKASNAINIMGGYIQMFLPVLGFAPIVVLAMLYTSKYILLKSNRIRWWIKFVPYLWTIFAATYYIYIGVKGAVDIGFVFLVGMLGIPLLFLIAIVCNNILLAIIMTRLTDKQNSLNERSEYVHEAGRNSGCLLYMMSLILFLFCAFNNQAIFKNLLIWALLLGIVIAGFIIRKANE